MNFDEYFSKYLDHEQLHFKCYENLKDINVLNLKFTFLLRTFGLHFGSPKICFNCHKLYLTTYNKLKNNLKHITMLMIKYNINSIYPHLTINKVYKR